MIETAYLLAGIAIGGGAGVIVGGLFAGIKVGAQLSDALLRERGLNKMLDDAHEDCADLREFNRKQGRRIAEYVADEQRRLAPLRAANAKRHADAEAARHARMEAADQRLAMKEAAE